jgi:hypothetical protein
MLSKAYKKMEIYSILYDSYKPPGHHTIEKMKAEKPLCGCSGQTGIEHLHHLSIAVFYIHFWREKKKEAMPFMNSALSSALSPFIFMGLSSM